MVADVAVADDAVPGGALAVDRRQRGAASQGGQRSLRRRVGRLFAADVVPAGRAERRTAARAPASACRSPRAARPVRDRRATTTARRRRELTRSSWRLTTSWRLLPACGGLEAAPRMRRLEPLELIGRVQVRPGPRGRLRQHPSEHEVVGLVRQGRAGDVEVGVGRQPRVEQPVAQRSPDHRAADGIADLRAAGPGACSTAAGSRRILAQLSSSLSGSTSVPGAEESSASSVGRLGQDHRHRRRGARSRRTTSP